MSSRVYRAEPFGLQPHHSMCVLYFILIFYFFTMKPSLHDTLLYAGDIIAYIKQYGVDEKLLSFDFPT